MPACKLAPIHPGAMLLEESMKPLGLSSSELARGIGVPPNRITQLIHGKRGMTADTALRLEQYLGWPAKIWLRIQAEFDLEMSRRAARHKRIAPHPQALAGEASLRQGLRT